MKHKFSRFIADYAPMVAFLYFYLTKQSLGLSFVPEGEIYEATAAMIFVTILSLPILYGLEKTISNKHLVISLLVIFFGGATLYFNDESYLKIKPTIFYSLTALLLCGGLLMKRFFLKSLLSEILIMPDTVWKQFTLRFSLFFVFMAVLNEIIWRSFSTDIWVSFKFFGAVPLIFLFMIFNISFLKQYLKEPVQ